MDAQREIARDYIIKASLRLGVGEETRFDKNVVHKAFPALLGGQPSEAQILERLQTADGGVYSCRRDDRNGDYFVLREATAPTAPPVEAPPLTPAVPDPAPAPQPALARQPALSRTARKKRSRKASAQRKRAQPKVA